MVMPAAVVVPLARVGPTPRPSRLLAALGESPTPRPSRLLAALGESLLRCHWAHRRSPRRHCRRRRRTAVERRTAVPRRPCPSCHPCRCRRRPPMPAPAQTSPGSLHSRSQRPHGGTCRRRPFWVLASPRCRRASGRAFRRRRHRSRRWIGPLRRPPPPRCQRRRQWHAARRWRPCQRCRRATTAARVTAAAAAALLGARGSARGTLRPLRRPRARRRVIVLTTLARPPLALCAAPPRAHLCPPPPAPAPPPRPVRAGTTPRALAACARGQAAGPYRARGAGRHLGSARGHLRRR